MKDLELPLGKRSIKYRLFEMLPAFLSYGAIILMFVLSYFNTILAALYLFLIVVSLLIKAVGIATHTIMGHKKLESAQKLNWRERLNDLEDPKKSYEILKSKKSDSFGYNIHIENLRLISNSHKTFPKPSEIYNAIIIATYNESYEILQPTLKAIANSSANLNNLIVAIAYEERGGDRTEKTVLRLQKEFKNKFHSIHVVKHPSDLPNEAIGKGANITYTGNYLKEFIKKQGIDYSNVIVTTLDSDNRPHKYYFDYLTYEYIVNENRKHLAFQPVCLFYNNIWDAPAPMRVIATGNSFWTIITSMRPHTLKNFASHSQPLDALVEMKFWSKISIVEDGHQYWRSYFYFNGKYSVVPIYMPIYQDAVLSDTYFKTLKAQFVQLRRWAYGASDVPYVAVRIFSKNRTVLFWPSVMKLFRLLDGHVTLACVSLLVAIGGQLPLLINPNAYRDPITYRLPDIMGVIQMIANVGIIVTVFMSFKLLPPRPDKYKKRRTVWMVLQWVFMPINAIFYSSMSGLYSQGRLFIGKYLDKFDVTDKSIR